MALHLNLTMKIDIATVKSVHACTKIKLYTLIEKLLYI